MSIHAFLFDFDGTILDTESQDFIVVSAMWHDHGVTLDLAEWRKGLGTVGGFDPYDALEIAINRPVDRIHWRPLNHTRYLEHCMTLSLRPGVVELLDYADAHHITLAVGSSGDRAWVTKWLTHHNLIHRFTTVVTRDDVSQVKPSPEIFLLAAQNIAVAPAQCLVFEDSAHGATAAARAGMRCVAVPIPALLDAWMPPVTVRLRSLIEVTPAELLAEVRGQAPSAPHSM